MKKILFLFFVSCATMMFAQEPTPDIVFGDETNNCYIIAKVDAGQVTDVVIKVYFNEPGTEEYTSVFLSPNDHGNLLVHQFAININGRYYSKPGSPVINGWVGNETVDEKSTKGLIFKQTDNNELVWMTSPSQSYINELKFLGRDDSGVHIIFKKETGLITGVNDVQLCNVMKSYDIYGNPVDENYHGIVINVHKDGITSKILK